MLNDATIPGLAVGDPVGLATQIAALPGWPFGEVRLHRIAEGYTNSNYLMSAADGDHFLKVPGAGTAAFLDRRVAHEAAVAAGERGVGPVVEFFDPASGVEVSAFLEGYRSSAFHDLADADFVANLMDLYRDWHAGPLLSVTKTLFDMIDEHIAQLDGAGYRWEPYQREVVDRWLPLQRAYIEAGLEIVPGHNDMLPSNYMVRDGAPMMLIDYDYAANTDRFYELGALLSMGGFDEATRARLIERYLGAPETPAVRARLAVCATGTFVKWGLWGLVNSTLRTGDDTDYVKYGAGMLAEALAQLRDPASAGREGALRD